MVGEPTMRSIGIGRIAAELERGGVDVAIHVYSKCFGLEICNGIGAVAKRLIVRTSTGVKSISATYCHPNFYRGFFRYAGVGHMLIYRIFLLQRAQSVMMCLLLLFDSPIGAGQIWAV